MHVLDLASISTNPVPIYFTPSNYYMLPLIMSISLSISLFLALRDRLPVKPHNKNHHLDRPHIAQWG